ncbi:MAG TPA: redoxin domain-containing protein [Candidatus Acidoferrales bacterium]|nr:redoxin domain-containing protein [Candidatus Acidoferrales bacterium]
MNSTRRFGPLLLFGLFLALGLPALAAAPAVGTQAPGFALRSPSGTSFSLAGLRGHVVVVNFFATWCPPCRAETPDLVGVAARYRERGVIFLGVDDREDATLVTVFAKHKGIVYPLVLDSNGSVEENYDVRAIPTTYVLDRTGTIRYTQVDELNTAVLSQAIDAVLAGTPIPLSAAAQKFHATADTATQQIQADLSLTASSPANTQALSTAITTGVAANKKLDDLLSQPDSTSIGYADANATRDKLDAALAQAYTQRAALPDSKTQVSDQVEATLLQSSIAEDQERFQDALTQYQTAIKLAPKDTRGYDGAYLAAYELKEYSQAASIASAEAQLVPDDPESWLAVASSQNTLKAYAKALDAERTALTLAASAYAKNPTSKDAAYELGRVWLKTARTELLAGDTVAARPLLEQAQAAAPGTIVAQQADEQYVALIPANIAIDRTDATTAHGADASPAKVYVVVRNTSAVQRTINLQATGLPQHWLVSFCYSTVCNPFKVSFALPAGGEKRVELLVAPLAATKGPWTMSVSATGAPTAQVKVDANTAKAAITISAS